MSANLLSAKWQGKAGSAPRPQMPTRVKLKAPSKGCESGQNVKMPRTSAAEREPLPLRSIESQYGVLHCRLSVVVVPSMLLLDVYVMLRFDSPRQSGPAGWVQHGPGKTSNQSTTSADSKRGKQTASHLREGTKRKGRRKPLRRCMTTLQPPAQSGQSGQHAGNGARNRDRDNATYSWRCTPR